MSEYIHVAVFASQILTVRSSDADTISVESCEKVADLTAFLWPSSVCMHVAVLTFQILTV